MPHNQIQSTKSLFDLSGKTAIVTGGAGILGQHFCAALAEHGANVVVADFDHAKAKEIVKKIKSSVGGNLIALPLDVTDETSIADCIQSTVKEFGSLDILHNNAASKSKDLARFFDPVTSFDMDIWREIMAVNLDGMFMMARAVGDQMIKQGHGGSIIQTASIYGVMAPDQRIYEGSQYMGMPINTPAVYSASKAGVVGLSQYLATYWADQNIRVNTITPGGVESGQNDVFKQRYGARVPLNRMGMPTEMVGALLFLASPASTYITGQNILIDGGLSAW